jgi:hypothetical protein
MGAKITFDATNRRFVVVGPPDSEGIIEIDLQIDLYSDAVEDWKNPAYSDLAGMNFPIDAIGGNPFGAKTLGISYLIKNGWAFTPYEADHKMVLIGNIGTQTGWELVDDTIGAYRVRVENDVSAIVSLQNAGTIESDSSRARKILTNRQEMVDTGGDVRIRTWDDDGTTVLEENIVTDPNDNDPALDSGASTKRGVSQ